MSDSNVDDRRQIRPTALLFAAYVGCLAFYDLATRGPNGMPALWPCNAVLAAGLMYVSGWRRPALIAACALSALVIHRLAGDRWSIVIICTVCDLVESCLIAWLVPRLLKRKPKVRSLREAVLVVLSALPVSAIMALISSVLCALADHGHVGDYLGDWFFSTALGAAVALPATLVILQPEDEAAFRKAPWTQALLYGLTSAVTWIAFSGQGNPMPFLVFPATMLAAFQLGPRSAAWSAVIVAAISGSLTASGHGPTLLNPVWDDVARFRMIQAYVITLFFTCLAAGLAVSKLQRLKRLLTRRQNVARAARARAQAANRAKSDFLATMSHEIRTPLNSILGFASLLGATEQLSADGRRRIDLIAGAGDSLVTLVNDILDFSRMEAGRVELDPGPVSPGRLLRQVVAIVAPDAQAKGLTLTMETDVEDGVLYALDESRLRQVLMNLLNNAVKFTASGAVTARLAADDQTLRFEIVDTGIGVTPEQQARLFQRFSQADGSIRRTFGGAGLGLAICKALVELMGGEIGLVSEPGRGSTFWVSLPCARADVAPAMAADDGAVGAARVLLVDDHPMNRELGSAMLTLAGCAVEVAEDGDEAVRIAAERDFDLILMDVHMPRMDGLAAAAAIRALGGPRAETPIVALTADVMPSQIERYRQAGMVDHVAKPIDREALYRTVRHWLDRESSATASATKRHRSQ
ncbi:ATP-binding protein [uncultured Caulobacter sp.]|uniref:ATP-binding protein n=1 Tax=uncultured Caulobacter sp. TaxID=158749 RepID=UPI00261A2FF9|nr:ATP-binding protein [uncultured Caulobacter sp.]